MSNSNRIEVRRWNPTMDGYDSVIISLGDGPGAINGRGKSDKIKEIVDEIDRLYKIESIMKEILEMRTEVFEKYVCRGPNGSYIDLTDADMALMAKEVFDAIMDL